MGLPKYLARSVEFAFHEKAVDVARFTLEAVGHFHVGVLARPFNRELK